MNIFKVLFGRKKKQRAPILGLALGSGGAKGFAALGILTALEENGITFDRFAGTSIGSIIGAFLAAGYSATDILSLMKTVDVSDIKNAFMINMDTSGMFRAIDDRIGNLDIEELEKPFRAVATNLATGNETVFEKGSVARALCASSSMPPFFKAVDVNGEKYIDGMIRQVETAALRCGEDRIELLLVNDAPDAPIHVETRSDVIDIRIHNSDQNRGIHGVKVWALSFAQGDYVHFLDQDDEISPDYYSSQLEAIGEADVVYCRGYSGRQEIYHTGRVFEDSLLYKNILTRPPMISFGQALLRKGSIPKLWTDHVLKNNSSDDYFLWLSYVSDRKTFATNDTL